MRNPHLSAQQPVEIYCAIPTTQGECSCFLIPHSSCSPGLLLLTIASQTARELRDFSSARCCDVPHCKHRTTECPGLGGTHKEH